MKMDDTGLLTCPVKGKITGERKCHPNSLKDAKRKLSFMNKKISDLHRQRKFNYKNSVKVKKIVHNQVNQIVKCLRARERSLWSDIDEAYISQDSNINDELSRLQSIYAHCQALFNHIEDFKKKADVLAAISSMLIDVNFDEKPDVKPLDFISDFEAMKNKINAYGYLEGDFAKKDFVLVSEDAGSELFDVDHKQFCDKQEKSSDQNQATSSTDSGITKNSLTKSFNVTDCEDFQIIDLLDNMHCHDLDEDFIMAEEENLNCTHETEKKFSGPSTSENKSNFTAKTYDMNIYETCENKDFNPAEEWKQVFEMNEKLTCFEEMIMKLSGEKQIHDENSKTVENSKSIDKQNKFVYLKEADDWLHKFNPEKERVEKEKTTYKIVNEINCASPAELIQKAFKPYLTKDDVQNWLSSN